jgi:hypothetical protein
MVLNQSTILANGKRQIPESDESLGNSYVIPRFMEDDSFRPGRFPGPLNCARKLSVTESQKTAQFFDTCSRRKCRTDRQKSL